VQDGYNPDYDLKIDMGRALAGLINRKWLSKDRRRRIECVYAFVQRYVNGRTHGDIGKDLNKSRDAVRIMEQRVKRCLRHPQNGLWS
jgi:DNA-directed RNA polymerase sigma subunit (sigma70/sigma32)